MNRWSAQEMDIVLAVMAEDAFRGVSKLQRGAQRTFRIFHAGAIRFVDDEHIRDFQDPGLDRLDLITETGCFHNDGGMRQPRHIHFALSRADRFDDDDLVARGIEDLHEGSSLLGDAAQRTAR